MQILKFRDGYIGKTEYIYCGRPKHDRYRFGQLVLGLGNPYAWKQLTKAKFKVANLQESLECYKQFTWKLIKARQNKNLISLESWEYHYYLCMEALAIAISQNQVQGLVCFCADIKADPHQANLICHTQILYSACLYMIQEGMIDGDDIEPLVDLTNLWG